MSEQEMIARLLFVLEENRARPEGAPRMEIDSPTVDFWFACQENDSGEDHDCWRVCQEHRETAAAILTTLASRTPEGMLEDDRFKAAIRAHERFNGTPARDFDADPLQESERRYWRPIRAAICPILPSGAE